MARKIAYWVATVLIAFVMIGGGVTDIARPPFMIEGMAKLGYPVYFLVILGVWKVLGGVVVLTPGLPTLKEWAYAGMIFDLTGASLSHAAVGKPAGEIIPPLVISAIVMASWALRPPGRRLVKAPALVAPVLVPEAIA